MSTHPDLFPHSKIKRVISASRRTDMVVVPLEDYDASDDGKKGFFARFFDFFSWTDEQRGIPENGGDIPVNRQGEGEGILNPGDVGGPPLPKEE